MRINKFVASSTGMSRRAADQVIAEGRVLVNGLTPQSGQDITDADKVSFNGTPLAKSVPLQTVLFNKPAGYVVSRDGQGSQTIYDLLPANLHHLKPVGRLDKFSSGLLLLTNDGHLAQQLTHPRYQKTKVYEITLSQPLGTTDEQLVITKGVLLADGLSTFKLEPLGTDRRTWKVIMREGRNRQIRRTFLALGYGITTLHRTHFGDYSLGTIPTGSHQTTN